MSLAVTAARGAPGPAAKFPKEAAARLSVSTYPFRQGIAAPHAGPGGEAKQGLSLEQFASTIVPKLKVHGIEPWSHHFESNDADYVRHLRDAFKRSRVHVVNIPVDVRVRLCGSPAERQSALETYYKWVDAAVILRSPSIRVHLPRGEKGSDIRCAVSGLKTLADYGATKTIVINLENDDPSVEIPERIVRVIKEVNSPYLRALPDFCNSMLIHNDQKYNNGALAELFPLAYNISHVKDVEMDRGKAYRVDLERIFAIAKQANYKGYFSMEWEGTGDAYEATAQLIEASLRYLR